MNNNWTPQWSSVVGYWRFAGTIGSISNGASIAATVGTNGTMTNTGGSYVAGVTGVSSPTAVKFTGSSYITMGNPASLNGSGLSQGTVMLWVKPNMPAASAQTVMGKELSYKLQLEDKTGDPSYPTGGYNATIYISTNGSSWRCIVPATPALANNQWSHIAATWDQTNNIKVFYNGVSQAVASTCNLASAGAPNNAAYNFQLGGWGGANEAFDAGSIDEAAVFNKALTDAEIESIYKRQKNCNY